jgi:hypothetical protein
MASAKPMRINEKEWRAAHNIIKRAKQLIEQRGWQQGSVGEVKTECLTTAMEHAFKEKDYSIVDFNYAREALSRVLKISREPGAVAGDELAVPYWGRLFMEWNDAPGRTKQQVLNALTEAASLAEKLANGSY